MSDEILIRADGVAKKFCRDLKTSLFYGVQDAAADMLAMRGAADRLRRDEFWALEDISFELKRGECLGLVGRNGAGKTTLLKMLNGLIKPDRGRIEVKGRVGALIALGAGFNPVLSGRENVYINGAVLGLSKKEIDEKYDEIVDFAELDKFINAPVQSYSSGMQVRLGFAVATALKPDVLLLDEVLAVGDAAFRTKCFDRIGKLLADAAVIFVSHSEAQIYRICDRALLMSGGRVVESGPPAAVLQRYRLQEGHSQAQSHQVLHESVSDLQITTGQDKVAWGGELSLDVGLTLRKPIEVGAIFAHLWRNGDFVASGEAVYDRGAMLLPAGPTEIGLKLAPLHLQNGRYSVSLAVFDGTRKLTIAHWLHFAEVQMTGPIGVGPPHLVPMTVAAAPTLMVEALPSRPEPLPAAETGGQGEKVE